MQVVEISAETNSVREKFFRAIFGREDGYVCIAYLEGSFFREHFFKYPSQLGPMLEFINRYYHGRNIYFCPQLLIGKKRTKAGVKSCFTVWADLDECDWEIIRPSPTIAVETSPGRFHGYWLLTAPAFPADAEDASHRLAYKYKDQGVDQSGWDLTQLLRVPITYNMKYEEPGKVPIVKVVHYNPDNRYDIEVFKRFEPIPGYESLDEPFPEKEIATLDPDKILEKYRRDLEPRVASLYGSVPLDDWSKALWSLEMCLLEAGISREETFTVCWAAKCNKFKRDDNPPEYLWKDILRAESKIKTRWQDLDGSSALRPLLSETERKIVNKLPDTFVERYVNWAKSRGDAAWQYHEAGAFVILSHILSSVVKLPTSFGVMTLNLWFMYLADTTLTRKSTAMEMAMDLLLLVDPDAVLATDGSLEGLMTAIASRPNRSGIFWRDEFSGLLEAIKKKDYYAGMLETLTKLYDGRYQKRILRKETIEIKDPILIVYCGGIRSRILEALSVEHIGSGFSPRFIYIEAESSIDMYKPIGPMTEQHDDNRGSLVQELSHLKSIYDSDMSIHIGDQEVTTKRTWAAKLTPEAWERYNTLERAMIEAGVESSQPELFTPMMDRLAKSTLKCAVLFAASRQDPQGDVTVGLHDILRAIRYAEGWRDYSIDVVENAGKTASERRLESIYKSIRQKHGVTRSQLMQNYHLGAREAEQVFDTLEQRGLIRRVRDGRTERLFTAVQ